MPVCPPASIVDRLPVLLLLTLPALLAIGCSGDDAETPVPDAGPPGLTLAQVPPGGMRLDITGARVIDGRPVVDFTASTADGLAVAGITADDVEFTLARLTEASDDQPSRWTSYVNTTETPDDGEPTIHPTVETGGAIEATGGAYTYTFAGAVDDVDAPLAVAWAPDRVHRVGLQLAHGLPVANAVFDFVPESGATDGLPSRSIVTTAACNGCHSALAQHGGGRVETAYCVTCHTADGADAQTGRTLDFKVLIHKIHMGRRLPSVQGDTPFVMVGFGGHAHDYSDVKLPMDVRNCATCHDPSDPATPDAAGWQNAPSIEACGACHDDIDFALDAEDGGHPGGPQPENGACLGCHSDGGEAGSIADAHALPGQVWARRFAYEIVEVADTAPGQTPRVTYRVTNPLDGDAPYDLQADPEFTSSNTRVMIDLSWTTDDYGVGNDGPPPASPLAIDALTGTPNGDGTYTVVSPFPVPETATGSGAVVFEGHPAGDFQGDGSYFDAVPVDSVIAYFTITDETPRPRRQVVDSAKCLTCHGENDGLARHGGNRVDDVAVCVTCHNPNNTDLAQRPTDPDGMADGINAAARDGIEQRSVDLKTMVHAIHAADMRAEPLIVYGYLNLPHDFSDVRFPGNVARCQTCHLPGTYTLPLSGPRLATTVDTGATVVRADPFGLPEFDDFDAARDAADDLEITPIAAACGACHDAAAARTHMQEHGAGIGVPRAEIDAGDHPEMCVVCHGPGEIADVELVHSR